jgi:DNA (cytosine-5)-methyltransferase 1
MTSYYNEIDPYCVRVLRKQIAAGNLPDGVVDDRDIREVQPDDLRGFDHVHLFAGIGGIPLGFKWAGVPDDFNIWTGGFPCQDISNAGKRAGIDGERSGLWSEYIRLVRVLRPRYVLVENVAALLGRGVDRVLGDLAACGYGAEWDCIPAAAFGAPHLRDRLFIVAYARCAERRARYTEGRGDARELDVHRQRPEGATGLAECGADVADPGGGGRGAGQQNLHARQSDTPGRGPVLSVAERQGLALGQGTTRQRTFAAIARSDWWATEPDVGRVAHGIPARVDRLRGLGNAVVPQVAEWLGRRILEAA